MPAFALPDRSSPSCGNRFATDASQSAYPNLWKGLLVGLSPSLGFNGTSLLRTYGMRRGDATLVAMESDNLSVIKGRRCLRTQTTGGGTYGEYVSKGLSISAYPISVSGWCYPQSSGLSSVFTLSKSDVEYLTVFYQLTANKLTMTSRAGSANEQEAQSGTITASAWHHVVAVWETATKRRMYIDGVQVTTGTTSCTCPPMTKLYLGTLREAGSAVTMDGYSGTTLVYNRVLLHDEIQTLYTDHVAPFRVRHRFSFPEQVEAGGVSVPKFMHHYKVRRTA